MYAEVFREQCRAIYNLFRNASKIICINEERDR